MKKANVPVVPGYHGTDQSLANLTAEAEKIGYPVIIKAWHGGGGKGMKIVERREDLEVRTTCFMVRSLLTQHAGGAVLCDPRGEERVRQ